MRKIALAFLALVSIVAALNIPHWGIRLILDGTIQAAVNALYASIVLACSIWLFKKVRQSPTTE